MKENLNKQIYVKQDINTNQNRNKKLSLLNKEEFLHYAKELISSPNPFEHSLISQGFFQNIKELALFAFQERNSDALWKCHLFLYLLYSLNFEHIKPEVNNQFDFVLLKAKSLIESIWDLYELSSIPIERSSLSDLNDLQSICTQHPVYKHDLFTFIKKKAKKEHFAYFLKQETMMSQKFFNFLILTLMGSEGSAKIEVISNMWDECGKGKLIKSHYELFKTILNTLNLDTNLPFKEIGWETFAGINLFYYLGIYRKNYPILLGCMAIAELFDSHHYSHILEGFQRINLVPDAKLIYYSSHTVLDQAHGAGWVNQIIKPFLKQYPTSSNSILKGVFWRLKTLQDYYDYLLNKLLSLS